MPAYSYVMYRTMDKIPEAAGHFHAAWRQKVVLLGKEEYVALDAKGKGKFVGWNVTVRRPGYQEFPVDENEKFFVDGEAGAVGRVPGIGRLVRFQLGISRDARVLFLGPASIRSSRGPAAIASSRRTRSPLKSRSA